MKLTMLQFWQSVRASYWFVPSLMVLLALVLAPVMVWLDAGPLAGLFEDLAWYQKSKPAGAREVLSSVAGSAITVAGVVFSITIVAISFAANQYGPRILTNFMSDRGNQVTLGTFISTFVYCIVVLRTIYSGDEEFVPQLAVLGGLFLAFCSIVVLIYFIHHVPQSIHVNHVLASIGRQLIQSIEKRFPTCFGDAPEQDVDKLASLTEASFASGGNWCEIDCLTNGYLQAVDNHRILSVANKYDLVLRLERSPGEFLYRGQVLFRASPPERVDDHVRSELRESWSVGSNRTPTQDQMFLIDELVEIAARALSPGVNDPYTAITCMDWLTAAAAEFARRQEPSAYRLDGEGKLRVVAPVVTFQLHVERGFGRLRPYAAGDVNAGSHFLSQLALLSGECRSAGQVQLLAAEAEALFELASDAHEGPSLERLEREATSARAAFTERLSKLAGPAKEPVQPPAEGQAVAHSSRRAARQSMRSRRPRRLKRD